MNIYCPAYFNRPTLEHQYFTQGKLRDDEELILKYVPEKARVLSIGCGRGWLEHLLTLKGCKVTGLDLEDFRTFKDFPFVRGGMDAVPEDDFDAVVFCESIEHIAEDEFERNWPKLRQTLQRNQGRLIVANWEHYHPLVPNGWDHIRLIDDAFYDRLARDAKTMIYRKGSHLVLDF